MPAWRVGTRVGRTLYRDEKLVGMVDTPELAAALCLAMNRLHGEGRDAEQTLALAVEKAETRERYRIKQLLGREANRVFNGQEMDYPSNVLDAACLNLSDPSEAHLTKGLKGYKPTGACKRCGRGAEDHAAGGVARECTYWAMA